jgi:transcriptional regulator with XRE-family HTH domain
MDQIITVRDVSVNRFSDRRSSQTVKNGLMDFPARLKQLRQAAGLTQEALALKCGWSGQSRVGNYEAGRGDPKFSELPVIAEALGVPVAALFEDVSSPADPSHLGRIDADKLAEAIAALRQVSEDLGWPYDPVTHPTETVLAYEVRCSMPAAPAMADVINFGQRVAEILRRRGANGGPGDGGQAGGADQRGAAKRTGAKA